MPEPYLDEIIKEYIPFIAGLPYGDSKLEDFFPSQFQIIDKSDIRTPLILNQNNFHYITNGLATEYEQDPLDYLFFHNTTSITQPDLLAVADNHVQDLIFQIKSSSFLKNGSIIANNLISLFNDAKYEEPDSVGISANSLESFINFLQLNPNLQCPAISLTPDYNIYTSWRAENKKVFSINFLPNGDARFVIFRPNIKHPERMIRVSGIVTIDVLIETVSPYLVREWIIK